MRRLVGIASIALLTFFGALFGMRFAESSIRALLTAQLTQPQIVLLPNSFDNQLGNMLSGPDGNVWVKSQSNPRGMVRVKPDNTMAGSILWGSDVQGVGDGGVQVFGGKVWAELCGVQNYRFYCELSSIAPDGAIVAHRRYDDGGSVSHVDWQWGLFPGPDGFLWGFSEGSSYKISPNGEFIPFAIMPPTLPAGFVRSFTKDSTRVMTKGGDGNMWEFVQGRDAGGQPQNYFVSISPQGISTPYLVPKTVGMTDGTCPQHPYYSSGFAKPTLGPDGNIWYAINAYCAAGSASPMDAEIGKVLPNGTMQRFAMPDGVGVGKMIAGPDGNVWFIYANLANNNAYGIGNVTPQGDITLTPVSGYALADIALGTDGNIWFVTQLSFSNQSPDFSSIKIGKLALSSTQASSVAATASSAAQSSRGSVVSSAAQSSAAFVAGNRCGNGILNSGEECDDANTNGGDGCSASCTVERGYACSGTSCYVVCGDGILIGDEQCDDNNRRSGDGCSAVCLVEGRTTGGTTYQSITGGTGCGDGKIGTGETCDDANRSGGDGCSSQCLIEDGYSCYLTACAPVCGDGKTKGAEQCDDANRKSGDGCSDFCRLETGYACSGTKCALVCGDGIPLGAEQCDDGNTSSGDGCTQCRLEAGWYCGGRPSQCYRYPFLPAAPATSSSVSQVFVATSSVSSLSATNVSSLSAASSSRTSAPFILPDWSFNMSSSSAQNSSVRFFSRASSTSSSSSSISSSESSESVSLSSDSSSYSSEESSLSSASSQGPSCGNGLLEEGEECDAGSLNGTPVSQCDATCVVLKPAASAASSVSSAIAEAPAGGGMNPLLLMVLIATFIVIVGLPIAYLWIKYQKSQDK